MKERIQGLLFVLVALACRVSSWNNGGGGGDPRSSSAIPTSSNIQQGRRQVLTTTAAAWVATSSSVLLNGPEAVLAAADSSLAERLSKRDPAVLKNRLFNIPPSAQVFPEWMRGDWTIKSKFSGYLFPSSTIPKERLVQNVGIAGFQKCSIAVTADVGKENVSYNYRIDTKTGMEDRPYNFQQQIDAYLGYNAVKTVIYDGKANPNRIGIDFIDYKTVNAERIELFCNARESESYKLPSPSESDNNNNNNNNADAMIPVFVCAEYVRQVTFGTGSTYGVPRQAVTNYANFYTWRPTSTGLKGNLLTAAYLDPADSMYFEEPNKPVAVYSHVLTATPEYK